MSNLILVPAPHTKQEYVRADGGNAFSGQEKVFPISFGPISARADLQNEPNQPADSNNSNVYFKTYSQPENTNLFLQSQISIRDPVIKDVIVDPMQDYIQFYSFGGEFLTFYEIEYVSIKRAFWNRTDIENFVKTLSSDVLLQIYRKYNIDPYFWKFAFLEESDYDRFVDKISQNKGHRFIINKDFVLAEKSKTWLSENCEQWDLIYNFMGQYEIYIKDWRDAVHFKLNFVNGSPNIEEDLLDNKEI